MAPPWKPHGDWQGMQKLSKMMQSDRLLADFSRALDDITLSAIILPIVLPFRQIECVLDIEDSELYSFSENLTFMSKINIFVY